MRVLKREGVRMDAQHDVALLAAHIQQIVAVAIAAVADVDIARCDREMPQAFGGVAVGDDHLAHTPSQEVITQMRAPIVATSAGVGQAGSIN